MLHLKRLVVFLDALKRYVLEWKEAQASKTTQGKHRVEKLEVMTVAELSGRLGRKAAGVNLLEVAAYLKRSKVTDDHICFQWQRLAYLIP